MKLFGSISSQDVYHTITNRKYITITIFIILSLWSFPSSWLLFIPQPGGDVSWIVGILWGHFLGFHFGKDIVWDYGPLGHLLYGFPMEKNYWFHAVVYQIISHFLWWTVITLFAIKTRMTLKHATVFALLSYLFVKNAGVESLPLLAMMLIYYLILKFKSEKYYFIIPLSFVAAFLSFIKFNVAISSIALLIVFSIFLLKQKKWLEILLCFSSYGLALVLIWVAVGEPLSNLQPFLSTSWEISSGYTAALSQDQLSMLSSPLAVAGWILILATIIIQKFKLRNPELFFLSLILLFIFFKHGIVRNDAGHVTDFIFGWPLLLYPYYSSLSGNRKLLTLRFAAYVMIGLFIFACFFVLTTIDTYPEINPKLETFLASLKYRIVDPGFLHTLPNYLELYFNDKQFSTVKAQAYTMLTPQHPLSNSTLNLINNNTVDIFPHEIDLLYYYNMNWFPRPVIQSIVAYTDKLDSINSIHFENGNAPKFILFDDAAYHLYPLSVEPATFRTILCNYKTIGKDTYLNILEKNPDNCTPPMLISKQTIGFGQKLVVPSHNSDFIFAKIFIHYNALGKISEVLYKPPQISVTLNGHNDYRFSFLNAPNGILLDTSNNVRSIFPWISDNIDSMKFDTDKKFYNDIIEVEFFSMNYTRR